MKTIQLDLNKLNDEELEWYLRLKKVASTEPAIETEIEEAREIVDKPVATIKIGKTLKRSYRGKYLSEEWLLKAEALEDFLAEPKNRYQCLNALGGGGYKTLEKYLKRVYGSRLKLIKKGKTISYFVKPKPKEKMAKAEKTEEIDDVYRNAFDKVKEKVDSGLSFKAAFMEVTGRKSIGGYDYDKWRAWLKERGLPEDFKKPVIEKTKRKIGVNPYFDFKNKYLNLIRASKKISTVEATKMLAMTWRESGKNMAEAEKIIQSSLLVPEKEILPEEKIVEPEVEKPNKKEEMFETFPKISNLPDEMRPVLAGMVERIANDKDLTLSFDMEGRALNIENYADWREFCENFLFKATEISRHMGLVNKFSVTSYGKGIVIRYG